MGSRYSSNIEPSTTLPDRTFTIPKEVAEYPFPFENLVLAGGGLKTLSYIGGLRVLQDIGALKNIKRFAGAGGGALICLLVAVGCKFEEIYKICAADITALLADASFGRASILPNLIRKYGWHPGNKVEEEVQRIIEEKLGDGNTTFEELYRLRGVELCIVTSNISRKSTEYYHPKTTPRVPLITAIKMSMAVPGFHQPVTIENNDGPQYYVDGSILCRYPLFAFDGWYLSMEYEDAFLNKVGTDEPRFGKYNDKTLGMMMYSTNQTNMLRSPLHKRIEGMKVMRPYTFLSTSRQDECDRIMKQVADRQVMIDAAKSFWTALHGNSTGADVQITLEEFTEALNQVKRKDLEFLFGEDFDIAETFKSMDADGDGQLTFGELISFMDQRGVAFREAIEGTPFPLPLQGFLQFTSAVIACIELAVGDLLLKNRDIKRTIGIHSDYIRVTDFELTVGDQNFLVKQAEAATIAYLQEYIKKHPENNGETTENES